MAIADVSNQTGVTLVEFTLVSLISIICPIFLLRLYFLSRKGVMKLSTQLIIHLFVWVGSMITAAFYALPVVLLWRGDGTEYNTFYGRLSGALNFGAMMVTPISAIFLTIDRIISLAAPTFPHIQRRALIRIPSLLTIVFCYANTTYLAFTRSRYFGPNSPCLIFTCYLPKGSIQDLMMSKLAFSFINVALGGVFIYLYYRYNKTLITRRERKKNTIVFTMIINEAIFCAFPTCVYFICDVFAIQYASRFGPFMTMGHSMDILVSTQLFYRTWLAKTHGKSQTKAFLKPTQIRSSQSNEKSRKY